MKGNSCNSPEGLQLYQKETATEVCSCKYIPKVLGTAFLIELLWWLLINEILVSEKNFLKKKISGELTFALICLFHVQIQEP